MEKSWQEYAKILKEVDDFMLKWDYKGIIWL